MDQEPNPAAAPLSAAPPCAVPLPAHYLPPHMETLPARSLEGEVRILALSGEDELNRPSAPRDPRPRPLLGQEVFPFNHPGDRSGDPGSSR